jgi:hypothetical protein
MREKSKKMWDLVNSDLDLIDNVTTNYPGGIIGGNVERWRVYDRKVYIFRGLEEEVLSKFVCLFHSEGYMITN